MALFREQRHWAGVGLIYIAQGRVASNQGDYARAQHCYHEAFLALQEGGDERSLAFALEGFALLAMAHQQWNRGVRLFRAAEIVRERMKSPRSLFEQAEYDASIAAAHAHLSEADFVAAWTAGQAMTLDEALVLALSA
jgi:hypothetical protein